MQRAADWFREARAELPAARDLCEGRHWAWCRFTAQQAAEKALKAIGEHVRGAEVGHNLNVLVQAVEGEVRLPPPSGSRRPTTWNFA